MTTLGLPFTVLTRALRPGINGRAQFLHRKRFSTVGILTLVRVDIFHASSSSTRHTITGPFSGLDVGVLDAAVLTWSTCPCYLPWAHPSALTATSSVTCIPVITI